MEEFKPQLFEGKEKDGAGLPEQTPQEIKIDTERRDAFKKSLLESGFDLHSRDQIKELGKIMVGEINKLFGEKYTLSVPEEGLPYIYIGQKTCYRSFNNEEGKRIGIIELAGVDDILDGNAIAEETSHFYRAYFKPKETHEEITEEFFGFLGSRLLQNISSELNNNNLEVLVVTKKRDFVPKQEALDYSKSIRDLLGLEQTNGHTSENNSLLKDLKNQRKSTLIHQRGYEYASKVDLEKIRDWKKLFSMPNTEVRRRFFTPNPDYSGL